MVPHEIEIEAKFTIPDLATFTALQQMTQLDGFELKPIGVQIVVDRYLDTMDQRLYQAGFACRIRDVRGKRILNLKSLTPAESEIHRRQEIEMEVAAEQPQAWTQGETRDLVIGIVGSAPLRPLFTLYQTRYKSQAYFQEQPVIELSLDKVSLHDIEVADYFELEAELIEAGTETILMHFIETLRHHWSLEAETQSKFQRALANMISSQADEQ